MLKYFYALLQEKETANIAFKLETSKGYLNNVPNSSPIAFTSSTSGSYSVYTLYKMPIVFQHYLPNTVDTSKVYVVNKQENYFFEYWSLNNANKGSGCEVNEQKTYTNGTTYTYIANFYKGIKITLDANGGKFALSSSLTCIKINNNPIYNEQGLKSNNCAEEGYLWSDDKIIICFKSTISTKVEILRAASVTNGTSALTHTNTSYKLAGWSSVPDSNSHRKSKWTFTESSNSMELYATWGVETEFVYIYNEEKYASTLFDSSYASYKRTAGDINFDPHANELKPNQFSIKMVDEDEADYTVREATYEVYYNLEKLSQKCGLVLKFTEFGVDSAYMNTWKQLITIGTVSDYLQKLNLTLTNNDTNTSIYNSGTSPIKNELNVEDCKNVTFKIEIKATNSRTYKFFGKTKISAKDSFGMSGPIAKFTYLNVVEGIPD